MLNILRTKRRRDAAFTSALDGRRATVMPAYRNSNVKPILDRRQVAISDISGRRE